MADTVLKDGETTISCDEALRIARIDAESAYRDLSIYRIAVSLDEATWLVDYELKGPELQGGGPHYVIDARTGAILSKRYEQ
jgi:uncharacterized membrane protein YkoI